MAVCTRGVSTANVSQQSEFVEAGRDMAQKSAAGFPGATAMVLRGCDRPNLLIGYGPWTSPAAIASWRASATFEQGRTRIRASLKGFEPHTTGPVGTVGAATSG